MSEYDTYIKRLPLILTDLSRVNPFFFGDGSSESIRVALAAIKTTTIKPEAPKAPVVDAKAVATPPPSVSAKPVAAPVVVPKPAPQPYVPSVCVECKQSNATVPCDDCEEVLWCNNKLCIDRGTVYHHSVCVYTNLSA
jgi:hypothetical protein